MYGEPGTRERMFSFRNMVFALTVFGAVCWSCVLLASAVSLREPTWAISIVVVAVFSNAVPLFLEAEGRAWAALGSALISLALCAGAYAFGAAQGLPHRVGRQQHQVATRASSS